MSIIHFQSTVIGTSSSGTPFAPTFFARQSTAPLTSPTAEGFSDLETPGSTSIDAETEFWLETTAGDCFIRLDAFGQGNGSFHEKWWDTGDADQGAPGTDENAMQLNERPDTVNIFTFAVDISAPSSSHVKIGTFTDDDKSTFFNPTDGVNYGWTLLMEASDPGDMGVSGSHVIQFTFRKAGFADLTVFYSGFADAQASDNS